MSRPERRFYFRLALALGYAHPDYLLAELTPLQVAEWQAYDTMEPIGEYRRDYMEAQILAMIQNIAQSVYSKKGATPRPVSPFDFIPWDTGLDAPEQAERPAAAPTSAQSPEDIKALFQSLKQQLDAAPTPPAYEYDQGGDR